MTNTAEFECLRYCQSAQLCDLATMAKNQKRNLYDNRLGTTLDTARRFIARTERAISDECAAPGGAETALDDYRDTAQAVFGESV